MDIQPVEIDMGMALDAESLPKPMWVAMQIPVIESMSARTNLYMRVKAAKT